MNKVSTLARRVRRNQRGMATAEYAVGTLAATGIAGMLWLIVKSEWFQDLVKVLLQWIFDLIMKSF